MHQSSGLTMQHEEYALCMRVDLIVVKVNAFHRKQR